MTLKFNGNTRLDGEVFPSGSVYSSVPVLAGSLLFKEVLLNNVPNIPKINEFLTNSSVFGITSNWSTRNSLQLNTSTLTEATIFDPVLIAPLLIRLGEVTIKKSLLLPELFQLYKDLEAGFTLAGDDVVLKLPKLTSVTVNLENNLAASIAALILSVTTTGEVVLNNFLLTEETLDLISFLKSGGFEILEDPKEYGQLRVTASSEVTETNTFSLPASSLESAFWAAAAVMSFGDIAVKNVSKERMVSFLSKLSALGVHFDFNEKNLRVWHEESHSLSSLNIEVIKNAPLYDFLPLLIPLMLRASGESRVTGITITDEPYIKDLNLFDAKIFDSVLNGRATLKGTKVAIPDFTGGLVLILAALGASGRSDLLEAEKVCDFFDNLPQKLEQLSQNK